MNEMTANPFGEDPKRAGGALASAEGQRAITEVQAALIIAHNFPRDQRRSMDLVLTECTREGLATEATYEYARGGTPIIGPSIRLAEMVARNWGNFESGVKEVARHHGFSECMAYAWDLQTNTREVRSFTVRHIRDTKQGPKPVTEERDIYELVANYGARRKRACITSLIPGDVWSSSMAQCDATLKIKLEITPEFIATMLERFAEFGITKAMIEAREQRRIETISPAAAHRLRRIYTAIKDGITSAADEFDLSVGARQVDAGEAKANPTERMKEAMKARKPPAAKTAPAPASTSKAKGDAKPAQAAQAAASDAPVPSYAEVRHALEHAKSVAEVGIAGDDIERIADAAQREELETILDARLREFDEAERERGDDPLGDAP